MFCGHWNPFKALRDRRQRRKNEWGERWQVRVVVVGDCESGKSCLIQRYCSGTLPHSYTPTLFDTTTVTSTVLDKKVQMIIQDTAGQEDLSNVRPPCYMHADVVLVCFCPGAAGSWERVARVWVPEARKYCGKGVPLVLVACKVDSYQGQSLAPLSPTSPVTSPFTSSPLPSSSSPFVRSNDEVECEEEEGGFSSSVFRRDATRHHHRYHHHHQKQGTNDDDDGADDDESSSSICDARDSGFFEMADRDRDGRLSNPRASVSSSVQNESPRRVSVPRLHTAATLSPPCCQSHAASLSHRRDESTDTTPPHPCVQRQTRTCGGATQQTEEEGAGTGQWGVKQQGVSCSCNGQQQQETAPGISCWSGDQERGVSVARQVGAVGYFETSAVRDTGIELAFQSALTAAMAAKQWRKKYMLR